MTRIQEELRADWRERKKREKKRPKPQKASRFLPGYSEGGDAE